MISNLFTQENIHIKCNRSTIVAVDLQNHQKVYVTYRHNGDGTARIMKTVSSLGEEYSGRTECLYQGSARRAHEQFQKMKRYCGAEETNLYGKNLEWEAVVSAVSSANRCAVECHDDQQRADMMVVSALVALLVLCMIIL